MDDKKYIKIPEDKVRVYTVQRQYTMAEEELMKRLDMEKDWLYSDLARELGQRMYENGDLVFTTEGNNPTRIKCQLTALSGTPLEYCATSFHLENDYIYKAMI